MSNVRAQVTADLDFSQTEQTAETYRPNPAPQEAAIRSQQINDSGSGAGVSASGVPGALSNQPPGAASAPITAPAGTVAVPGSVPGATASGGSRESTVNYELDKTIKHTKLPVGSVKRLSAAVVVNYKKNTDKDGKVSVNPLTTAELTQVNNLVKEAMGFDPKRGDSLNVVNAAFNLPEPEKIEETAFYDSPRLQAAGMGVGKFILIALLIWFLVFKILMPILRQLAIPPPPPQMMEMTPGGGAPTRATMEYQDNLQAARQMAQQDPKVVANVVKEWVGGE